MVDSEARVHQWLQLRFSWNLNVNRRRTLGCVWTSGSADCMRHAGFGGCDGNQLVAHKHDCHRFKR